MPAPLTALPGVGVMHDEVRLGHVQGAFGVRGELRLFLHNPESTLFAKLRSVVLVAPDGKRFAARLQARPGAGRRILGRLEGPSDRDVADGLAGYELVVPARDLPRLADDEVYVRDLLDAVVVVDGVESGRVVDVQTTAGGDVLVVRTASDVRFVPLVKAWVLGVDAAARRIELATGALDEP